MIAPELAYLPSNAMALKPVHLPAILAELWMTPKDMCRVLELSDRTWSRWRYTGLIPGPAKAAIHAMVLCKRANLPHGEYVPIYPEPSLPPSEWTGA